MSTKRIYVALSTFSQTSPEPLEMLRQSGFGFTINQSGKRLTKEQVMSEVGGHDAVIAGIEPYDKEVLAALPQLHCISRCGVGVDNIDLNEAKQRNIIVLNTPDAVITPVAELTIAMIFDVLRRLTVHTKAMHERKWEKHVGVQLAGKTVGIVGLGRIGRKVAELLKALGCVVIANDIKADEAWAKTNGVQFVELETLLKSSDIVSIHINLHTATGFMFGDAYFQMMKQGSYFINTARGNMVNERALHHALVQGHLAGAGLDVYSEEPYQGPLCDLPNVILTPHVATLTQESRAAMEIEAVAQCLDVLSN